MGVVDGLENKQVKYCIFFTIINLSLLFTKQTLTMSSCSTDCVFSPDEKVIMTGTSVCKGQVGIEGGRGSGK